VLVLRTFLCVISSLNFFSSKTDFFAQTICDLLPTSQSRPRLASLPELLFFIEKVTHRAGVTCKVIIYAMIYLERAKEALPKGAVGNYGTYSIHLDKIYWTLPVLTPCTYRYNPPIIPCLITAVMQVSGG
jgi:hypothetical protein